MSINIFFILRQVESLLEWAAKNCAMAATLCNERSSRSHSVFMLKISGHNDRTGQKCEGMQEIVQDFYFVKGSQFEFWHSDQAFATTI